MITPQLLHAWYLEATAGLHTGSFNPEARKPYEELTEEQKSIDVYIANRINEYLNGMIQKGCGSHTSITP